MAEEEKELLGFQPHIRTIMEDIEIGVQEDQVARNNIALHIKTIYYVPLNCGYMLLKRYSF